MAEIKSYKPSQLSEQDWFELQNISRESFSTELDRSQEEVDFLVGWTGLNEVDRKTGAVGATAGRSDFYKSHVNPNYEVGKRYNPDQSYSNPKVVVATENGRAIGFGYTANNVSGENERKRLYKRLSIVKNYLWLREIVVKPESQRRDVASRIGERLMQNAIRFQPVATYIWPEEIDFLQPQLHSLGFRETGDREVYVFGEDKLPVKQVRMQAPSVHVVRQELRQKMYPGE